MDSKQIANFVGYLNGCFQDVKTKTELVLIRDLLVDVGKTRKIDKQFHHLLFSIIDQDKDSAVRPIVTLIDDYLRGDFESIAKIIRLKPGQIPVKEELFFLINTRLNEEISGRPDDQTISVTADLITVQIPEGFSFDGIPENLLKQLEIPVETLLEIKDKIRDGKVLLNPDLADNFESLISIFQMQKRQKAMQEKHANASHSVEAEVQESLGQQIESNQQKFDKLLELAQSRVKAAEHFSQQNELDNALITYKLCSKTLIEGLTVSQRYQLGDGYRCKKLFDKVMAGINYCLEKLGDLKLYREILEEYRILHMETQHRVIRRNLWPIEAGLLIRTFGSSDFKDDVEKILQGNTLEDFTVNILLPMIEAKCSDFKNGYAIGARMRAEFSSKIFLGIADDFCKDRSPYELCQYYHKAIRQQKTYDQTMVLGKIFERYMQNWNKIYWSLYNEIVKTPILKRPSGMEDQLLKHMEDRLSLRIGGEIKMYRDIIDTFSRLVKDVDGLNITVEDYEENGIHSIKRLVGILNRCEEYVSIIGRYIPKLTKDVMEDYVKNFSSMMFNLLVDLLDTSKILFDQCDLNVTYIAKYFRTLCETYIKALGKTMRPPPQFLSMQYEYFLLYATCLQQMGLHDRALPNLEYLVTIDNNPEIQYKVSNCKKLCKQLEKNQEKLSETEDNIKLMRAIRKECRIQLENSQVELAKLLSEGKEEEAKKKEEEIIKLQEKIKTNEENMQKQLENYPKV